MAGSLGIGNGIGIPFRNRASGGGQPLPPELKEALCGIWIADQNTNESPTKNIIKNKLKDRGGDFEILNAAYKNNSGYNGWFGLRYGFDRWDNNHIHINNTFSHTTYLKGAKLDGLQGHILCELYSSSPFILKIKIKVDGLAENDTLIVGQYNRADDGKNRVQLHNGLNQIILELQSDYSYVSFFTNNKALSNNVSIDILSEYQGAFVTDGVDDLIVSQKPVSEMLGGSSEITVVSMIHKMLSDTTWSNLIGELKENHTFVANRVQNYDKIGIYGYNYRSSEDAIVINNILGNKNDYICRTTTSMGLKNKYYVTGYEDVDTVANVSQVAWYWTLIAKRVLTTDEINQVIAYYNLDKYVVPDVYYDVKKQGLTNENHAEFGDKLIDYSGNGRDMQLYNFGWKLDSGVGKYEEDFTIWVLYSNFLKRTASTIKITDVKAINPSGFILWRSNAITNFFKVRVTGIPENGILKYSYKTNESAYVSYIDITENGKVYELPSSDVFSSGHGFILGNKKTEEERKEWVGLTIEQIPSFENALVFNGVDDYGQYVGDLGLKDYTMVADRAYVELMNTQVPIISSISDNIITPFLFEHCPIAVKLVDSFSFGTSTRSQEELDIDRKISYQSTYVYNGNTINKGISTNTGSGLTFGRYGSDRQYAKLCLYNFMLFPYSLSEFLIERQLKKRKIGTLYPETNNK